MLEIVYVGGAILIWSKILATGLGLGLIAYGCYKLNAQLSREL